MSHIYMSHIYLTVINIIVIVASSSCGVNHSYRAFAHKLFYLTSWQLVMQVLFTEGKWRLRQVSEYL